MHTLRNFLNFLRQPIDRKSKLNTSPIKVFLLLLILDIILMFLLSYGVDFLGNKGWLDLDNHAVLQLLMHFPWYWIILLAVIFIPFLEELIFRFPLRFEKNYLLQVPILLISGRDKRKKQAYKNIWDKYFSQIFYLSAIAFALIHAMNYNWDNTSLWLTPLLVLPQFILALFIGYLRVQFNFTWGFLFHALHNLIFIGISFFGMEQDNRAPLTFDYETSKIIIQEVHKSNSSSKHIGPDTLAFENMQAKNIIESMYSNQKLIINSNKSSILEKTYLNLSFKNHSNLSDTERNALLLEHIGKYLNYEYEKYPSIQKSFTIKISNEEKLKKHISALQSENINITISKKNLRFENVDLMGLRDNLINIFPYAFIYINNNNNNSRYDFQFSSDQFSTIRQDLEKKYGIYLEESQIEMDSLYFRFE